MSKSVSMPIEKEVWKHLETYFSDVDDISMAVGVSGGADSMCLLDTLHQLGTELHIVHVNYQKRGAAADKDAKLVEDSAANLGVACEIIRVDPGEAEGKNFQQWARQVRYRALQLKVDETGADGIAVAHHQDDQIETILQKIFRGGGMASWQAMQVWNGRLFRPLLNINRNAIEEYCREHSISYRHDESNFESDFARNFLRNEWLPEMEQHFPGWRANVLRVADQASIFKSSLQYIFHNITDDKDRLNRKQFLELDQELQKSVLIYYANKIDPDQEISRNALSEVNKLPSLQTGKGLQLTSNMEFIRDRDYFKLVITTGDSPLHLTLNKEGLESKPISLNGLKISIQPYNNPDFNSGLYLDTKALQWPLQLRRWREGDKLQPLGMEGHQKVADHLTNRKVSALEKGDALVLESFEESICAVIFPPIENRVPPGTISEWAKCRPSTQQCLTITRL